jgi:hypothetical protein
MTAAVTARQRGLDVLIVEKEPRFGGILPKREMALSMREISAVKPGSQVCAIRSSVLARCRAWS